MHVTFPHFEGPAQMERDRALRGEGLGCGSPNPWADPIFQGFDGKKAADKA